MNNLPPRRQVDADGPRVNEQIRIPKIRLVDENGEMVGVVTVAEGMRRAEAAGLDLVEVSPNAEPPVCKILNYGKYKYEQQKKANEARKKQKVIEVKELKIRPGIEQHDYDVKLKAAKKFLENEDKVKFTLRLRGREMAHIDLAMQVMQRLKADLAEFAKVEQEPKMEGRQAIMMMIPAKTAAAPAAPAAAKTE
ncbi:MAG: translation initiation factor IF-3 [Micavibrio aeruginosavorus]|uniref:Translation initiation factor IF-3 n=1 Tax=Micavibrio aeruginosavorus TaxID=349221 RepID=A0A2W5C0T4_9BACT|nr:MAG: translation initiation factor IF-3 [Micavibrio aeruginosavorus]